MMCVIKQLSTLMNLTFIYVLLYSEGHRELHLHPAQPVLSLGVGGSSTQHLHRASTKLGSGFQLLPVQNC